jgi:thiol-disulfide isomerase/thioredoxin
MRWLLLCALVACAAPVTSSHPAWPRISGGAGVATVAVVFASWCGPCRHELAVLGEVHAERPGLRIVGLNAYEDWEGQSSPELLRVFLAEHAPWLPVVSADDELLGALGGVPKIPSVFVFSADGRLVQAFRRSERLPPEKAEILAVVDGLR